MSMNVNSRRPGQAQGTGNTNRLNQSGNNTNRNQQPQGVRPPNNFGASFNAGGAQRGAMA